MHCRRGNAPSPQKKEKKKLMYSNRYTVVCIGLRRMGAGGLILGSTSLFNPYNAFLFREKTLHKTMQKHLQIRNTAQSLERRSF